MTKKDKNSKQMLSNEDIEKIEAYRKKSQSKNRASLPKNVKKYTPEEISGYILEFLKYAMDEDNETVCSRAAFVMWLLTKHKKIIHEQTLINYDKDERYAPYTRLLIIAQRAQLEKRSLFSVLGQSGPMTLMLKSVGYDDKVIHENIEMPKFEFGGLDDKLLEFKDEEEK